MISRLNIYIIIHTVAFILLNLSSTVQAHTTETGGFVTLELQISSVNKCLGFILGILGGFQTKDGLILGAGIFDLLNGKPFPNESANNGAL
jgi:hypothetical protein